MNIKSTSSILEGRFKNKTILITGGARGICKATAIRAAKEGANVVIADILEKEGKQTLDIIKKTNGKAIFVKTDVRNNKDCENMVKQGIKAFKKIDYVVNGAGVMDGMAPNASYKSIKGVENQIWNSIHLASDEYWNNVMDVNINGLFKSMREELKQMIKQGNGGSIVNVGSIAGTPAYVASKYAVTGITKNAAIDYAPYGIRVNSVNMAATKTPMTDAAYKKVELKNELDKKNNDTSVVSTGFIKNMSLLGYCDSNHRMSTPEEQAAVILFLLSDEASNITGASWATDGGWTSY